MFQHKLFQQSKTNRYGCLATRNTHKGSKLGKRKTSFGSYNIDVRCQTGNNISNDTCLLATTNFLDGTDLLLSHGRHDRHHNILSLIESKPHLGGETIIGGKLEIILGATTVSEKAHEAILSDINQLVINTVHMWNITIVGRWNNIFKLLSSEDINSNKVTFGVTVLASFGSRNLNNLIKTKISKSNLCSP